MCLGGVLVTFLSALGSDLLQVYRYSGTTAEQHERRAVMACLLLPPVQTFMLMVAAAVLVALRRGLGCAASTYHVRSCKTLPASCLLHDNIHLSANWAASMDALRTAGSWWARCWVLQLLWSSPALSSTASCRYMQAGSPSTVCDLPGEPAAMLTEHLQGTSCSNVCWLMHGIGLCRWTLVRS